MNAPRSGVALIQGLALWNISRGYQAGLFFTCVFGIYTLHQRIFMIDQYKLRSFLIAAPFLLLHMQFWKSMTAFGSRAFDLAIHGRLFRA